MEKENSVFLSKDAIAAELTTILKRAIQQSSALANATVKMSRSSDGLDPYGQVEKGSFEKWTETGKIVCFCFNVWKGQFSIESTGREYDDVVIWIAEEVSKLLGMPYNVAVTDPGLVKQHMDKCPYCGHGQKTCQHCGAPI